MILILIGLPGCGKSTLGKAAAAKLGTRFVDTDHLIEDYFQKKYHTSSTCREIFNQNGEVFFRSLESEVVRLLSAVPSIVATGGGTLLAQSNVMHLKSIGKVVYLKGKPDFLYEQAIKKGIPSFLDPNHPLESYREMAKNRSQIYEKAADYSIDITEKPVKIVVDQLCEIGTAYG